MKKRGRQDQAEEGLQELQLTDACYAARARPRYQKTNPTSMLKIDT
jgi:hypothetical protein